MDSQPWHDWYFRPDNSLWRGSCPVFCTFSSIAGLHPLDRCQWHPPLPWLWQKCLQASPNTPRGQNCPSQVAVQLSEPLLGLDSCLCAMTTECLMQTQLVLHCCAEPLAINSSSQLWMVCIQSHWWCALNGVIYGSQSYNYLETCPPTPPRPT